MQQQILPIQLAGLIVSAFAFLLSILALYISRKSWLQANRPIVTARVTSFAMGGDRGTPLDILVENTGNRPALNIKLSVDPGILDSLLADNDVTKNKTGRIIRKVFSDRGVIPVLGNGKSITNSFGFLSQSDESNWKDEARLEIQISYEDLDARKFNHRMPLFIAGDEGFAKGSWNKSK